MMKIIVSVLLCLELLVFCVHAEEFSDSVPDFSSEILEEITGNASMKELIEAVVNGEMPQYDGIIKKFVNIAVGDIKAAMGYILSIMGFAILSSCIKGSQIRLSGSSAEITFLICYFVVSGFLIGVLRMAVNTALGAAEEIVAFIKMALPAYIGIVTSMGVNVVASQGIFLAMVNVVSEYAGSFMINAFFYIGILSVISNMSSEIHITKLIDISRQILFWVLGFLLTMFAGMTALSGLNAAASSTAGIRAAKYTIGHAIPVVGGFLADSTELIMASAGVFKSAFGTVGITILAVVCLVPVLKLLVMGFLLKVTSGLCEPFCDKLMCDSIYQIGQTIIYIMVGILLMTVMFIMAFAVLLSL